MPRLYELETRFFDGVVGVFFIFIEREREKKENVVQDSLLVTMMKTNERDTLDGINAKFSPTFPSSNLTDIINRNNTIITCHLD